MSSYEESVTDVVANGVLDELIDSSLEMIKSEMLGGSLAVAHELLHAFCDAMVDFLDFDQSMKAIHLQFVLCADIDFSQEKYDELRSRYDPLTVRAEIMEIREKAGLPTE